MILVTELFEVLFKVNWQFEWHFSLFHLGESMKMTVNRIGRKEQSRLHLHVKVNFR
jgi:hypothetical protein